MPQLADIEPAMRHIIHTPHFGQIFAKVDTKEVDDRANGEILPIQEDSKRHRLAYGRFQTQMARLSFSGMEGDKRRAFRLPRCRLHALEPFADSIEFT